MMTKRFFTNKNDHCISYTFTFKMNDTILSDEKVLVHLMITVKTLKNILNTSFRKINLIKISIS